MSSLRRTRLLLGVAGAGLVLAAGLGVFALLTPPPTHVAAGCIWWTATPVDRAADGERGCFRGYFVRGGGLADAAADPVVVLHMDLTGSRCAISPGDPMVVRGEARYGEGRTTIFVDACR
ncbi:MAG TPA: hypothetical protein VOB72_13650 [Candidatus Dormibacteraeota bacterium]|nr:hypothetical protein [Candidatus Dormibacteraeota bacterium]